jgi:hypothetical protein
MPQTFGANTQNRIGKEAPSSAGGAWRLLSFMILVFSVFLITYFGFEFGYQKFLKAQIASYDEELTKLAAEVSADKQEDFLKFQLQLQSLKNVLASHTQVSEVMKLFEGNTNQRVAYTNMTINVPEKRVIIQGVAGSYEDLASQLMAYDEHPQVAKYQITNMKTIEGGRVEFNASLFLDARVIQFTAR